MKDDVEAELNKLELVLPSLPSEQSTSRIDEQISDLRRKIEDEQTNIRKYARDMVGESRGTLVNPDNSGFAGQGQRYWTAYDLKTLSERAIADLSEKIVTLEQEKKRALSSRQTELEAARGQTDLRKNSIREHLRTTTEELAGAQQSLSELENGREPAIRTYTAALKEKPNFVPVSFGMASQFRALRRLYKDSGSTFELIMIKLFIMMLELTPVLQKVFFSPTTLYAVKLEAAKRTRAYEHYDEEVRLRKQHLKNKFDAAFTEAYDEESLEKLRQSNVSSIRPGRGAG